MEIIKSSNLSDSQNIEVMKQIHMLDMKKI